MHQNFLVMVVSEPRHLLPAAAAPAAVLVPARIARSAVLKSPVTHSVTVWPVALVVEKYGPAQPVESPAKQPERHAQKRIHR